MTNRGPRMSLLLSAAMIAGLAIDTPRRRDDEPLDPPRPPEPLPPPPGNWYRPPSGFRQLATLPTAPEPRTLTRDEIAAQEKRERRAARNRAIEARKKP